MMMIVMEKYGLHVTFVTVGTTSCACTELETLPDASHLFICCTCLQN